MKKIAVLLGGLLAFAAVPAMAAEFELHGDLNNRFGLYTNQAQMFSGVENVSRQPLDEDNIEEFFADIKYRLEAGLKASDYVKGVFAIELGGIQFGTSPAGDYSGDGVVVEVRKAYTEFQLPNMEEKALVSIGLQPFTVNKFVWWETVPAVQLKGTAGAMDYTLSWARGLEFFNEEDGDDLFEDADALLARGDFKPAQETKLGLFALYQRSDSLASGTDSDLSSNYPGSGYLIKQFAEADYDIVTLGIDGGFTTPTSYGNGFVNWDLIYQTGSVDNDVRDDQDVSSYLIHADVGANVGKARITYTGWYASGDDDDSDDDIENFLATDVDRFDSIIFFEGGYTDDDYFTEAPYILNKGLFFNKLALDYKATEKTDVGLALLYLMTAEDLKYMDDNGVEQSEDALGTEVDAYVTHQLYPSVEVALNAGYLFADDGMDFWENERDGSSDTDVFRTTARVRYKF